MRVVEGLSDVAFHQDRDELANGSVAVSFCRLLYRLGNLPCGRVWPHWLRGWLRPVKAPLVDAPDSGVGAVVADRGGRAARRNGPAARLVSRAASRPESGRSRSNPFVWSAVRSASWASVAPPERRQAGTRPVVHVRSFRPLHPMWTTPACHQSGSVAGRHLHSGRPSRSWRTVLVITPSTAAPSRKVPGWRRATS